MPRYSTRVQAMSSLLFVGVLPLSLQLQLWLGNSARRCLFVCTYSVGVSL